MSSQSARSVSLALVGGVAAMLFFSQGLFVWAGLVGWAAFLDAGGDTPALMKTIAGTMFGAVMGWVALRGMFLIDVPPEGWLWIPRAAIMVVITLFLLSMATRIEMFSRLSTNLFGYASMFAASGMTLQSMALADRLSSFHFANPFVLLVLSMAGGSIFGLASNKLTEALTKK